MKIDWITDPHLTHLPSKDVLIQFLDHLYHRDSDALFVTGDIAEGDSIAEYLELLAGAYQRPLYVVLGNHDYYGHWMNTVTQKVERVCQRTPKSILHWMNLEGVVPLTDDTCVIGHDGWYCGLEGSGVRSLQLRPDFASNHGVRDLVTPRTKKAKWDMFCRLSKNSADVVGARALQAREQGFKRILVLTHVPPIREASLYRGRVCDDASAPFYVNGLMGDVLREQAQAHPDIRFEVYCGHTHSPHVHVEDNLTVHVGAASLGRKVKFLDPIQI